MHYGHSACAITIVCVLTPYGLMFGAIQGGGSGEQSWRDLGAATHTNNEKLYQ